MVFNHFQTRFPAEQGRFILDTWPNHHRWDLSIRRNADWCSGFYEFHSCELCREVSHRELFTKVSSLLLVLEIALFQSLHNIHDHSYWNRNMDRFKNWQLCDGWMLPFYEHGTMKLTQYCVWLTNLYINLLVLPSVNHYPAVYMDLKTHRVHAADSVQRMEAAPNRPQ